MASFGDELDFGHYLADEVGLLPNVHPPLGEGFEATCTDQQHIKADHSSLVPFSALYDETSPQSSGSSRNSFDSSPLAPLTESPTSRKSSLSDNEMMGDADVSKPSDWASSFQFLDTGSPLFPDTIDPSTIEHGQANQAQGQIDHGSPLSGTNLFAPQGDGSSPATMDKDSPSNNIFTFGSSDFQNYVPPQSMDALITADSRSPSTPFSAQRANGASLSPNFDFAQSHGLPQLTDAAAGIWAPQPANDMALYHDNISAAGLLNRSQLGIAMPPSSRLYGPGPYKLDILLDSNKRKSRVETQSSIKVVLSPLPPGIKRLHIPHVTVGKTKLWAKPSATPCPDTLELHVAVVCTSAMKDEELREAAKARARQSAQTGVPIPFDKNLDPLEQAKVGGKGGEVRICKNCVTREGKRAKRKKKVKSADEEALWDKDASERIILFNTNEIKDWSEPRAEDFKKGITGCYLDMPIRITCYCRHHHEKSGFQVIFTVTNYLGEFVAQDLSPSIMITDDHKTNTTSPEPPEPKQLDDDLPLSGQEIHGLPTNGQSPFSGSHVNGMDSQLPPQKSTLRNLSRSASPLGDVGPSSKRRKPSSHKIPANLQMTPVGDVSPRPIPQMPPLDMNAAAAASAFPPDAMQFSSPSAYQFGFGRQMATPFGNSPSNAPTNGLSGLVNGNVATSLEHMAPPMYSAPASAHASRAPSPNGLRTSASPIALPISQPGQMHPGTVYNGVPIRTIQPPVDPVVIQKVIPGEGPKAGGIEVTVLGVGLTPGVSIMFGDVEAIQTAHWSPNCTICILPPSPATGTVAVTMKGQAPDAQRPTATFTYNDDDENKLLRLALRILSNGGSEDVVNRITRGIIGYAAQMGAESGDMTGGPSFNGGSYPMNSMNLESEILKVLELIDLSEDPKKACLDLQAPSGHTMLHLASSLGLRRVVAGLLARGADPDITDKGGYTPLHIASLNSYVDIVRRLVASGADPVLRTMSGLTPRDVARSPEVRAAIPLESRATLPSSDMVHRRVRSATSLKSAWEPLSEAVAVQRMPSTDESSFYEDDDTSDDSSLGGDTVSSSDDHEAVQSDQEQDELPRLARKGASSSESRLNTSMAQQPNNADNPERPASPAATVAALREQVAAQFQHFQQAMALHLQSLPQFPFQSLPQLPHMPAPLTDYQQRLLAMVPTLGGGGGGGDTRPDSPTGKTTAATDRKWWDLSFMGSGGSAAPPPYEELYPEGSSPADTKQASAAAAAAEAEADQKCAALFDNPETDVITASSVATEAKTDDPVDGGNLSLVSSSLLSSSDEDGETTATATTTGKAASGPYGVALPEVLQIPRRNAITKEHRDTLRQAHAIKVTWLSSDWKLWCIWIPALVALMAFMLYNSAWVGGCSCGRGRGWRLEETVRGMHPVETARAFGKMVSDAVGEMTGAGAGGGGEQPVVEGVVVVAAAAAGG